MKRIQQIGIAAILALVISSTAFAGNITTGVAGNITTGSAGNITTGVAGNITTGFAYDVIFTVVGFLG